MLFGVAVPVDVALIITARVAAIIMGDHPFSFVDSPLTKKYTTLESSSTPTLMKYLHALDS